MIRILIVEDLNTQREYLNYLLSGESDMQVVGMAENGAIGVELANRLKPDVITMDIHMPVMDGFEATGQIMETCATPIIIVTASWDLADVKKSMRALEAGAVTAIEKPYGIGHPQQQESVRHLIDTVRVMAGVKVVTRHPKMRGPAKVAVVAKDVTRSAVRINIRLVAIGVSTGGPQVLQNMLAGFADDFPAPILIVQHISRGFLVGMRDWLQETTRLPIHIPKAEERALPGNVYLAPDDFQMGIDGGGRIRLTQDDPERSQRPSVSYLFRHAAGYGRQAIGCLLTGMGRDGADELGLMRKNGAVTFAQDEESSVVFGMPGAAVEIGAAVHIMPPDKIVAKINELAGMRR